MKVFEAASIARNLSADSGNYILIGEKGESMVIQSRNLAFQTGRDMASEGEKCYLFHQGDDGNAVYKAVFTPEDDE